MEATSSDRALIDIAASAKTSANIAAQLPAMHCLSGCDTVAQLFGVGKTTAIKTLQAGYSLNTLGDLNATMPEVISEAAKFIAKCYGCTSEDGDMSKVRVEVWSRKMGKRNMSSAPDLKTLPPTSQAFAENVRRAHVQTAIWKAALGTEPPTFDTTEYGWTRDEATKTVTLPPDVSLAPPEILELIRYGCISCRTAQCGCCAAHMPCTFFCACHGESDCHNEYTKQVEQQSDDDVIDESESVESFD